MTVASSLLLTRRFLLGGRKRSRTRLRGGVIGVGVSLIPLVIVLQVTNGMIAGITSRFIEAGSSHLQVVARSELDPGQIDDAVALLSDTNRFTLIAPERQGLGLAASGDGRTGVTIRAVQPDLWERDAGLRRYLEFRSGSWDLSTDNSILLGEYVAQALGASVGDDVQILTARSLSGDRFLPRSSAFTVTGILSTGYADLDRLWVLIPYSRGARVIPDESARIIIGAKVTDPLVFPNPLFQSSAGARSSPGFDQTTMTQDQASELLTNLRRQLGTEWRVVTWFEAERAKFMSFKTTKDLLVFIMVLIVVVAAVNISSALVMLVLEKQEEIAVLKSLGASPGGIRRTFLLAGFTLGAVGTTVGIGLGLLLAVNINEILLGIEWFINTAIRLGSLLAQPFTRFTAEPLELLSGEYYLETIPIEINVGELFLVSGLTLLLATAAAYFPATRASRIRPLEVLRKR